jgi:hypothetical protein
MQFYGISFTHPYKQAGRWQDVLDTFCWFLVHMWTTEQGSKNLKFVFRLFGG